MRKETVEYLEAVEADVTNMDYPAAVKHLLFHLVKQTARVADCFEQLQRERRGY